jgi:hypothetical protein
MWKIKDIGAIVEQNETIGLEMKCAIFASFAEYALFASALQKIKEVEARSEKIKKGSKCGQC